MTLNQAFNMRVKELLREKNMTQYKLEQATGLYHSTVTYILTDKVRNRSANFRTMALIIRELGVTMEEFFNSPLFNFDNLDID